MTVRKGLGVYAVKPSHLSKLQQLRACKLANLETIQNRLRTMSKIIIASKNKPIMSSSLEQEIEASLIQYQKRGTWAKWGMADLRKKGNMVLLEGPPGTGKTTIAVYMSKRISKGMLTLNMKDVGGKEPGHCERMIADTFRRGNAEGGKTIFMDEVEAILWDRSRAGSDSMWMVGVIDELLMQTAQYKHMIVAATNMPGLVDDALKDRCFAVLQIGMPEKPERIRLWRQKIPNDFPCKMTTMQIEKLSDIALTGRKIEDAIVREASIALVQDRLPTYTGLVEACNFYLK